MDRDEVIRLALNTVHFGELTYEQNGRPRFWLDDVAVLGPLERGASFDINIGNDYYPAVNSTELDNLYERRLIDNVSSYEEPSQIEYPYWVLVAEDEYNVRDMLDIGKEEAQRLMKMRTDYSGPQFGSSEDWRRELE